MYNYTNLCKYIDSLYESANESNPGYKIDQVCVGMRNELNKFSPDFLCKEVIFTPNFDKQFFGIYLKPIWPANIHFISMIMAGYTKSFGLDGNGSIKEFTRFRPYKYILEIDGRLLRDFNLSPKQIASIIIREVCVMNSAEPVEKLRNVIDNYMALTNDTIDTYYLKDTSSFFVMACNITIHNLTCIFAKYDISKDIENVSNIFEDPGMAISFKEAINKIMIKAGVDRYDTTSIMISWYFSHYKQLERSRDIQYVMRNCLDIEPSEVVRSMIINSVNNMERLTYEDIRYYRDSITESTKKKGLLYQMKRNGLRSIEEDLYEYNMRLRNVETQDDAILLMRQINSRMSILEEYLATEELEEKDRKRWEDCYKKYLELREALSKKTVYNKKMYGLFVDYNALQNMSQTGNLMNTYY